MAIYKRGQGFELETTENKSSKWPERDSNPGLRDYESDVQTTQPRCLHVHRNVTSKILVDSNINCPMSAFEKRWVAKTFSIGKKQSNRSKIFVITSF